MSQEARPICFPCDTLRMHNCCIQYCFVRSVAEYLNLMLFLTAHLLRMTHAPRLLDHQGNAVFALAQDTHGAFFQPSDIILRLLSARVLPKNPN
jgi:hypothetical protein